MTGDWTSFYKLRAVYASPSMKFLLSNFVNFSGRLSSSYWFIAILYYILDANLLSQLWIANQHASFFILQIWSPKQRFHKQTWRVKTTGWGFCPRQYSEMPCGSVSTGPGTLEWLHLSYWLLLTCGTCLCRWNRRIL